MAEKQQKSARGDAEEAGPVRRTDFTQLPTRVAPADWVEETESQPVSPDPVKPLKDYQGQV